MADVTRVVWFTLGRLKGQSWSKTYTGEHETPLVLYVTRIKTIATSSRARWFWTGLVSSLLFGRSVGGNSVTRKVAVIEKTGSLMDVASVSPLLKSEGTRGFSLCTDVNSPSPLAQIHSPFYFLFSFSTVWLRITLPASLSNHHLIFSSQVMSITLDQALANKDYKMVLEVERRRSFPSTWPLKGALSASNVSL